MNGHPESVNDTPLLISRSHVSTEINKTGAWRFMRPEYEEKTAPCGAACPAGEDIARIQFMAGRGHHRKAWEAIMMENPFPAVCGRVCFHPCQGACNRGCLDGAVAIHHVERFIGDTAIDRGFGAPPHRPARTERVAIAGSGPAGLSAAYFLCRLGYPCDIFEAEENAGGLMRWGIPSYRLPEGVLNAEIGRIVDLGTRIFCGRRIDADFLKTAGKEYAAVFIGCGQARPIALKIPGADLARDGLAVLRDIRRGDACAPAGRVAIIGGGNTAVDLARSLLRLGAEPVIVYRRRLEDMPAFGHEVKAALAEGVTIMELLAPARLESSGGQPVDLGLLPMRIDGETADGRARVVPAEGEEARLSFAAVYAAIGAEPDPQWRAPSGTALSDPAPSNPENAILLDHCAILPGTPPTLYGGDLTNAVASVTDAIASGKAAAMAIDTALTVGFHAVAERLAECRVGQGKALSMEIYLDGPRRAVSREEVPYERINTAYFPPRDPLRPMALSAGQAVSTFEEVERGFLPLNAMEEAERCFNCGICNDCDNCRLFCPEIGIHRNDAPRGEGVRRIDLEYCKGCGICVVECPRCAMNLKEERL